MAFIRQESGFRHETLIAGENIDITDYDLMGRLGTNGTAVKTSATQVPQFIFLQSALTGESVKVAFIGSGGQVKRALSSSGHQGTKIRTAASGEIGPGSVGSAVFSSGDFGVALADWQDSQEIECMIVSH